MIWSRAISITKVLIATLLCGTLALAGMPASAQTTTTTDVNVVFKNEGKLDVSWVGDAYAFLPAGGGVLAITASEGATATATLTLMVDDTRAPGQRSAYGVSMSVQPFALAGTEHVIPAGNLSVSFVTGLPIGVVDAGAAGKALGEPVSLCRVPTRQVNGSGSISIGVTMAIPPGTYPGTYTSAITVDIVPLA